MSPTTWEQVPAAVRTALAFYTAKVAVDGAPDSSLAVEQPAAIPGLSHLADILGWRHGTLNAHWGGPRPLTNTLIGAGLGALTGYGAGRLAKAVAPKGTFDEEDGPEKKWMFLGGLAGALPGVYQGYDNFRNGLSPLDQWPKRADIRDPLFTRAINAQQFNQAVINDPLTPMPVRAATAGLVEAASQVSGSPLISPWDVTRIALSAGSGVASGMIVGKTLGLLAGLAPQQQKELQRAGYWAGVLKATVPQALGFNQ